jgi:hypothetical protein
MLLNGLLSLYVTAVSATCYAPDSTVIELGSQPCDNVSGAHSMCCATNRTTNADQCLKNGLCYNPNGGLYWREGCTDPTWTSEACSRLCRSGRMSSICYVLIRTISLMMFLQQGKAYKRRCSSYQLLRSSKFKGRLFWLVRSPDDVW